MDIYIIYKQNNHFSTTEMLILPSIKQTLFKPTETYRSRRIWSTVNIIYTVKPVIRGHLYTVKPVFEGHPVIRGHLYTVKPVFEGHPVIRGHFLKTVSYLPHVKEPATKGHPSCWDTFCHILRYPLIYHTRLYSFKFT